MTERQKPNQVPQSPPKSRRLASPAPRSATRVRAALPAMPASPPRHRKRGQPPVGGFVSRCNGPSEPLPGAPETAEPDEGSLPRTQGPAPGQKVGCEQAGGSAGHHARGQGLVRVRTGDDGGAHPKPGGVEGAVHERAGAARLVARFTAGPMQAQLFKAFLPLGGEGGVHGSGMQGDQVVQVLISRSVMPVGEGRKGALVQLFDLGFPRNSGAAGPLQVPERVGRDQEQGHERGGNGMPEEEGGHVGWQE